MKYYMINRSTGWLRHANGGRDTSDPADALTIKKHELDEWIAAFSDHYAFVPEEELKEVQ